MSYITHTQKIIMLINRIVMKKVVVSVMLVMAFCVHSMYAQNVDSDELVATDVATDNISEDTISSQTSYKTDNFVEAEKIIKKFQELLEKNEAAEEKTILVPVGKNKRWFITQKIGMSLLGGSDNDEDDTATNGDNDNNSDTQGPGKKLNIGFNADYSVVFARGRLQEDGQVKINPLGFAFNVGLLAAFDKQDHYGMTCDLMIKLGIETGFRHKMGFGFDLLYGTGRSCGNFYYVGNFSEYGGQDVAVWSAPYTAWCEKVGGQVWVRTGILHTGFDNNNDVRLFVRYVYSKDPNKKSELDEFRFGREWFEESWQIGLTYCHYF